MKKSSLTSLVYSDIAATYEGIKWFRKSGALKYDREEEEEEGEEEGEGEEDDEEEEYFVVDFGGGDEESGGRDSWSKSWRISFSNSFIV